MKRSSLAYFGATVLAITGAFLRITHMIDQSLFYSLMGVCIVLGTVGNLLRKRELESGSKR
ncbi:hypothetical protein [Sabulibacter ruber]|uniref:hypothetical protein n=1 Tax=Sabulibacter ruber TaxID=2811901 RepID=UPI001A97A90B|nr:hypothetical protein [Sabulibacter ruber]